MGKSGLFLLLFLVAAKGIAQTEYPQDYFANPLEIPLILSGTFGELRSNHFHAGLDIKTQQRQGLNVMSSAEGYVSRIKISHWGYGKALYITHPNGYTTVYGHLKKFAPKIEAYIKKKQYEKQSFAIELFPKPHELLIDREEIVAYSGNSGGSGGPHLHYEIRDAASKPMNPMLFGIEIEDSKKPEIRAAVVYSFGDSSHVDRSARIKELRIKRKSDGSFITDKIDAYGTIGIGINVVDKQNAALNNNGIFSLEMEVNGKKVYQHTIDKFSFSESRYINTLIDYERYYHKRQRIQKCFIEPNNKLSIYDHVEKDGYLTIENGASYKVKITARDFKGNSQSISIPIVGKKDSIIVKRNAKKTQHYFKAEQFNKIEEKNVTVAFPKLSFYNDLYFNFTYDGKAAHVHDPSVPLHKNFTLTFTLDDHPMENRDKLFIARKNKNGRLYYTHTRRKENKVYTLSKNLGVYTLAMDTIKPKITPVNFRKDQWLSKYRYLKLRISDNLSGIKSYRGEINDQWILLEFDPKTGLLIYDFSDKKLEGSKHTLKVSVSDNVNNTNTYIATFYRKE